MEKSRFSSLPPREIVLYALFIVISTVTGFWLLFQYIQPAPPRTVTMLTGAPGGAYEYFGEKYRQALAKYGVELVLQPTSGSVENLRRIKTEAGVDLVFIQGGIANEPASEDLISLGSMYVEPLWILYKGGPELTRLTDLRRLKVAVGAPGSGTQLFALQLLTATGIPTDSPLLRTLDARSSAAALTAGEIDAAFLVAAPEAPVIKELLARPDIRLLDLAHAEAYVRHFPHLAAYQLPAGSLDLARPNPPRNTRLLASTATLVVKNDLHPAIISLILQAAREIHGPPSLFQRDGEFPAVRDRGLPVSPVAQRFYDFGPPILQRYLPFWAAVIVERLIIAILPLLAILLPLMKIAPAIYTWSMRSRIYRWYGELKYLEAEVRKDGDPGRATEWLERLDRIEERATRRRIPLSFANELYTLREHIQLIRALVRGLAPVIPAKTERAPEGALLQNWRSGRDSNPRPPA
jgi:TRAP transporter TAXI family solute receptor